MNVLREYHRLEIRGSYTHTTIETPQTHPASGEFCSPPLGGERARATFQVSSPLGKESNPPGTLLARDMNLLPGRSRPRMFSERYLRLCKISSTHFLILFWNDCICLEKFIEQRTVINQCMS